MSDRISKCCGDIPSRQFFDGHWIDFCKCGKACDVETIAERDDRMREQGATWALLTNNHANYTDQEATAEAARVVAEHKEVRR